LTLSEALLTILLRLPGPWEPAATAEPPELRQERLAVIAEAIALETEQPPPAWRWGARRLAAGVARTWFDEGARFHREVHSGARTADRGKSACLGMVQTSRLVSPDEWFNAVGTDLEATRMCARITARYLTAHACRCLGPAVKPSAWAFASVVSGYGSGWNCDPLMRHKDGRLFALERGRAWWKLNQDLYWLMQTKPRSALALL